MRRKDRELQDYKLIEDIIRKTDVCHIALSNNDIPYIVTLNFGYSNIPTKRLLFHCASAGKKIEMIKQNNLVCFEFDTDHKLTSGSKGCEWGMSYSSVVGYGRIKFITEKSEKIKALEIIMSQYSDSNNFTFDESILERTSILQLDIEEITGKRKE
jgi:uncharacterized protein